MQANMDNRNRAQSTASWVWWVLGLIVLAFLAIWAIQAFSDSNSQSSSVSGTTPGVPSAGQAPDVTVRQLAQDPSSYEGRMISINGEIVRSFGSRVFQIGDPGSAVTENILVVAPSESTFTDGTPVTVSGTVRVGRLEEVLGNLGVDMPQSMQELSGDRPIVIASSVSMPQNSQQGQDGQSSIMTF